MSAAIYFWKCLILTASLAVLVPQLIEHPPFTKTFFFVPVEFFFSGMWLFQANSLLILLAAFCMLRHVEGRISAVGCFKDKRNDRALPELLHNYRGDELNWKDLSGTVIDKCQKLAEDKGYECFGIQFYGECWSGKDACDNYNIHGKSDKCWCSGNKYKQHDNPERGPCLGPVGGKFTNFVYKIDRKGSK